MIIFTTPNLQSKETGCIIRNHILKDLRSAKLQTSHNGVMNIEGNGPNKKTTILFDGIGAKQLLLQYAKLKIVN
jgi:hypothetical protein